ncbi:RNA methyltransferase [Sutterella sp.]|uniref:RNA methyltransferase n=1 Tax=Sutterella sp. TaxID=1981025 RepID=UPI0026DF73FF|nr:RNA methyltransferase [Sutterella sp.]MDO5531305.1 RNA methyltransferase [Sutterella sp.]
MTAELSPVPGTLTKLSDLHDLLAAYGAKPVHARKIHSAWLGASEWPTEANAGRRVRLPDALVKALPDIRAKLDAVAQIHSRYPGSDPESERLLVTLADEQMIESVLLPRKGVCVSTQIGCAVGCVFCMTGRSGLIRQLTDLEIVAQVAMARKLRQETKKVVFMGMGEPSHNLANVMRAVEYLADYGRFGHKELVISTVGDERLFAALHASKVRPALAISLHTVDDAKRRKLLPKGCRMSVDDLIDAADEWAKTSGYPLQVEWTLIEGRNDSEQEISLLAEKLKGRYAMVNFIPVNMVNGTNCKRPAREHAVNLIRFLRSKGIIATLRVSAAQDVDGGCGQLRARILKV